MRIWDSELLSTKKQGYVKNGLVLYLDGINNTRSGHNASSLYWEDLSGNNNDLLIVDSSYVECKDNLYNFKGNTQGRMVLESFGSMKGTYEVVCKNTRPTYSGYALTHLPANNGDKCRIILFASSGRLSANGNVNAPILASYTDFTNNLSTISITESSTSPIAYYVNGSVSATTGNASSNIGTYDTTKLLLGVRSYNRGYYDAFQGDIACVRVYDRVLTAAEILHNYNIDKERFGSGVTT